MEKPFRLQGEVGTPQNMAVPIAIVGPQDPRQKTPQNSAPLRGQQKPWPPIVKPPLGFRVI